jgi:hypothetical protein
MRLEAKLASGLQTEIWLRFVLLPPPHPPNPLGDPHMTAWRLPLLFVTIGAVAIDNNWDGFVHFKNWRGCVPNAVQENPPFQVSTAFPVNIAKDICAIDSECKVVQGV